MAIYAVCLLFNSSANEYATGFLISADEVLTAAHFVWNVSANATYPDSAFIFAPAATTGNPNLPNGPYGNYGVSGTIHSNPISETSPNFTAQGSGVVDFAVIHLAQSVSTTNGYIGLYPDYNPSSGPTDLYGYPGGSAPQADAGPQWLTLGNSQPFNYFTMPPVGTPGYSGGPYVVQAYGANDAVGSQSGLSLNPGNPSQNYSFGAAFTSMAVAEIENWLALNGESPAILRLYHGVLGIAPDAPGPQYWSNEYAADERALAPGVANPAITSSVMFATYPDLAQNFLNAHLAVTGTNFTSAQLVNQLYLQEFGYAGDPQGVSYWEGQLDNHALTQAQVVGIFASHPVAIAHLAAWTPIA